MKAKSINQIRQQEQRIADNPAIPYNRRRAAQIAAWRYIDNIISYLGLIFDAPRTSGDFRWLDINNREKLHEINRTPVDVQIYTYKD